MNTLDDLRSTLEQHSHDAGTLDVPARRSQLAGRIAAARRRRNAVRGGVALAAVVAVAGAVLVPRTASEGPEVSVADRTMLGQVAPAEVQALGIPYEFAQHSSTRTGTSVTVEPDTVDDATPLLTWTTLAPEATVTVTDGFDRVLWSSRALNFSDHVVLDQWEGGPVTVTSTSPGVAVAMYAVDEDGEVAGVGSHGATFRQRVAGSGLLKADFSPLGATVLRMRYDDVVAGEELSLAVHCSGLDDDQPAVVETRIGGEMISAGSGCNDPRDHTARGTYTFPVAAEQLDEDGGLDVEVEVVRSMEDSRPVAGEHPDVLLGAAIYEPLEFADFAGTLSSQVTLEHSGHLWQVGTERSTTDAVALPVELDPAEPHLVGGAVIGRFVDAADPTSVVKVEVDGRRLTNVSTNLSQDGVSLAPRLLPAGTRSVVLHPGTAPGSTGHQLLVWRLLD